MKSLALVAILALAVGCETTTTKTERRGLHARSDGGLPGPLKLDDPCADRLHNMIGPILLYIVMSPTRSLPPTLEDLKPLADIDQVIDLKCPVSGEPYVYVPGGLMHEKQKNIVIVHDPAPSHNGRRWCITMVPRVAGEPMQLEVVDIPEVFFLTYKPVE